MGTYISMPAHHPKWPVRCDQCRAPALGFEAMKFSPVEGDNRACTVLAMACRACKRTVLRWPSEDELAGLPTWADPYRLLREVQAEHAPMGFKVAVVTREYFREHCQAEPEGETWRDRPPLL